jgi:general secretion pathway protein F
MKTYSYRGFDQQGRARKGLVEASDTKSAREKLASDGILANKMEPAGGGGARGGGAAAQRVSASDRATVYRELGALLRAGMTAARALELLINSPESQKYQAALARVRDELQEGVSFVNALSGSIPSVTEFEKAVLIAGEHSGATWQAFDQLASVLEEQVALRDRVRTALAYPAVVVVVALIVAGGVFGFVLPQMNAFLKEMRIPLPGITRFMLGLGRWMRIWGLPIVGVIAVAGVWLGMFARRNKAFQIRLNRLMFRLPIIGKGNTILANLRFSRTLSILLHGGVSAVEGLAIAARATGSMWIDSLVDPAAEKVRHGASLSSVTRTIPPLADSMPGWIEAGEASGDLENMLAQAGERYQRAWNTFTARAMGLLEPLIVLLLGAFVLLVALAILLPILSANKILQ